MTSAHFLYEPNETNGSRQISRSKIIFVSFATLKKPADVDIFVKARGKTPETLRSEIVSHYPTGSPGQTHSASLLLYT